MEELAPSMHVKEEAAAFLQAEAGQDGVPFL